MDRSEQHLDTNSGRSHPARGERASAERAVRDVLERRAQAIHDRDAASALSFYSRDVVNFDLAPPLAQRGAEATEPAALQDWFDTWDGAIEQEMSSLDVRVEGSIGFAFGFLHLSGKRTDGSFTDVWVRLTVGLSRSSGAWLILHEHQSFPTMMDGSGRSASDLKP